MAQVGSENTTAMPTRLDSSSAITPLDWFDIRNSTSPEEIFRAIGRLRREARDEIDRLIRFLDESENHMCVDDEDGGDAEPDTHDEPSLGFLESVNNQEQIAQGGANWWMLDCEVDTSDDEPSLGFLERHPNVYGHGKDWSGNQDRLCEGVGSDLEDEHNGAEPDEADHEPWLGAPERFDQSLTFKTATTDYEQDDSDNESDEPLLTECSA